MEITQGSKYKIILSAAGTGSDVKYYLSQDEAHKISSSTGVFEGDIFSQFVVNKDIYAYATSSKGTTVLSKLKLNLVADVKNKALDDFINSKSTNILGDAPTSIIGQTGNFFLEGATFDLSTFKIPINPTVAIDANGDPVVYYASCTDNNTYGKNNTITKYDGIKTVLESGKYYILSMTANGDATELTYIMDKNGDTGDSTSVNAYTITNGTTTETDHETAIADVFYATLNGEEKFFYSDRTNIWYTNEDGEKTAVLAESTGISSSIHPVETDDGLSLIFTKNDGNTSELYVVSQTAEGWTAPVQISSEQKLIENVAVASNENKLYGCITTNEGGEINLVGFSFVNFTDITLGDIYISELGTNAGENNKFTVSVFNNGTNRVDSLEFTVSDRVKKSRWHFDEETNLYIPNPYPLTLQNFTGR